FPRGTWQVGLNGLEHLQQLLRLLGLVPLIITPEDLVGLVVHHRDLHRGGAHVHAHPQQVVLLVGNRFLGQCRHWSSISVSVCRCVSWSCRADGLPVFRSMHVSIKSG